MAEKILKVIPEDQLLINRFYLGRGRNTNIGFLDEFQDDGTCFITLSYKFEKPTHKYEDYLDNNNEGGCFQPFLLLPTLEEILAQYPHQKTIPQKEMEEYRLYFGKGKGVYIAQWGPHDEFLTWEKRMISDFVVWENGKINYLGKLKEGMTAVPKKYGEFNPFKLINEGEMVEPFGPGAWDRHYGKKLLLRDE